MRAGGGALAGLINFSVSEVGVDSVTGVDEDEAVAFQAGTGEYVAVANCCETRGWNSVACRRDQITIVSPMGTMVNGTVLSIFGLKNLAIDCCPVSLSITSWICTNWRGPTART